MDKSIFLIMFILITGCNYKTPENNIEVKVSEFKELDSSKFKGVDGRFFSVNLELKNNLHDSIRFWTFTCYWQINWISNSDQVNLLNLGCNSNFPVILTVSGGGKISYEAILRLHEKTDGDLKLRVAFILIKENELKPHPLHEEFMRILSEKRKNGKDVYWSNYFYLTH